MSLRRFWIWPLAAALAALLSACAAFIPEPEPADAGGDASLLRDLRYGRRLYIDKCGGCHRLYDVDSFADDAWRQHIQEMIDRGNVKLTAGEHDLLARYLTTLNAKPRP